jgi:hypothetical protein
MMWRKFYLHLLRAPLGPRNVLDCFWSECERAAHRLKAHHLERFFFKQLEKNAVKAALLYGVSSPNYIEARNRPGPPHWRRDLLIELCVFLLTVSGAIVIFGR